MERGKRTGGIVLLVVAGVLVVGWVGYALLLSIEIWRDRCPFGPTRCDFESFDDGFAAFQLAVAAIGAWLAFRRRWGWAVGVFAFWLLVPFLLLWTSQQ